MVERADNICRHALRMGQVQRQGYVGQALAAADLLAVPYFYAMNYRPEAPEWEKRDRFYLSIGHYAIALYPALIEAEIIPLEELETYGSEDSRQPMSGMAAYTPGMENTGGSLGQGLGIAAGACLGLKRKGSQSLVYNLLSDGELNECSTWEAVMSASHWKLDNLIAIVDVNKQQADGYSSEILSFEPIVDRWQAFGWLLSVWTAMTLMHWLPLSTPSVATSAPIPPTASYTLIIAPNNLAWVGILLCVEDFSFLGS